MNYVCLLGIDPEKAQKCKPSECASCGWEAAEAARRREYVKEHGLTLCADGFRRLIIKKENDMATPYKECPHCVVGENVPGIIRIAAGQVVKDLEQAGYHVVVLNFEAAAVGAWHRRSRAFFVASDDPDVADTDSPGFKGNQQPGAPDAAEDERKCPSYGAACECGEALHDPVCSGCQRDERGRKSPELADGRCWATEPGVGRVADGVPHRVDRLKCLGNAVVPQQAYPIFQAIADVERSMRDGRK